MTGILDSRRADRRGCARDPSGLLVVVVGRRLAEERFELLARGERTLLRALGRARRIAEQTLELEARRLLALRLLGRGRGARRGVRRGGERFAMKREELAEVPALLVVHR